MSRPTLELTRDQYAELSLFADRMPHAPKKRPNANLIRRGLLMRVETGRGVYILTYSGIDALREASS